MSPAERLVDLLADARRAGQPFAEAWPQAVAAAVADQVDDAEREPWLAALHATRGAWAAAWARTPADRSARALAAIVTDPDHLHAEPAPDPAPACDHCGDPLPPRRGAGRPARFCSARCRRDAHQARQLVAA